MVSPNESSRERQKRLCSMFLDHWVEHQSTAVKSVLVIGAGLRDIATHIKESNVDMCWWSWLPEPDHLHVPFPPETTFDSVIIRMPPEKERLKLCLEVAASRMKPQAQLWLFGSNDEGVKSTPSLGKPFFHKGVTVATRRHARIVVFERADAGTPRHLLTEYRGSTKIETNGYAYDWAHFPGTFAKGKLDAGSQLLVEALSPSNTPRSILDYGCGTGVLLGFTRLGDLREVHALDRDYLALEATKHNLPNAVLHWCDHLSFDSKAFDLIVSNPPIHDGKVENHGIVENLVRQARTHLAKHGELWMVVQHRVPVERMLKAHFHQYQIVKQNGVFKVWQAFRD
ncbi:MAG: methyltransferase [Bradymonadia bacterium]